MAVTPRQRFKSALHKKRLDVVPGFEIEFQLYWEYGGGMPVVGFAFEKLSPKEKDLAHGRNAEIMLRAAAACHHDGLKDIGEYWDVGPGHPALLWFPTMEDRVAHVRALRREAGDDCYVFATVYLPLSIPFFGDMTAYSLQLYDEPEVIHAKAEQLLQTALESQKRLLDAGADGVLNDCDVAFNSNPFLSPAMMDDVFFPYLKRWAQATHDMGVECVWHSDGNLMPLMNGILDSGIDGLHCIDPFAGMDVARLLDQTEGRLTLIGNMSGLVIHTGTPEENYKEATRILEQAVATGKEGYIFSSCNTIIEEMPKENYDAVIQARLDFNKRMQAAQK